MFVDKNNKRVNIYAPFTTPDGTIIPHLMVPGDRELFEIREIPDPTPPQDFTPKYWYVTEINEEPYALYTKMPEQQIKNIWLNEIKAKRDDILVNGGCKVNDKWFHTDAYSKQQQMALAIMGNSIPQGVMWKTMDGSFVEMTAQLASAVFQAQVARELEIFNLAESVKDTPEVEVNWPERYVPPLPTAVSTPEVPVE